MGSRATPNPPVVATGHVPEIAGHDAETVGHVGHGPKYARERAIGVRDGALTVVGDTMSDVRTVVENVRAKVVEAVNVGQPVAATVDEAPRRTLEAVEQSYAQDKFKAEEASAPGIFAEMRAAIVVGAARLRLATAGHDDPRWMTSAQIQAIGGSIRADAKPVRGYYYERGADGRSISLKTYSLANASQVDGVPAYEPLRSDRPAQRLRETALATGTEVGRQGQRPRDRRLDRRGRRRKQ